MVKIIYHKPKNLRKEKKSLEGLCTFISECSSSNFGDIEICKENYIDCKVYQKIVESKLKKYQR